MENLALYVFAAFFGWSVARGARSGLSQSPFSTAHSEAITIGLIWTLSIFYLVNLTREPVHFIMIKRDIKLWVLTVGVPWAICTLGLPMVLPHIWIAILASLRDSATQWLLTIVAAILSYGVFTISQSYADVLIQSVVQAHPDQFPGAQRALTFIGAIYGWIFVFYIVIFLSLGSVSV